MHVAGRVQGRQQLDGPAAHVVWRDDDAEGVHVHAHAQVGLSCRCMRGEGEGASAAQQHGGCRAGRRPRRHVDAQHACSDHPSAVCRAPADVRPRRGGDAQPGASCCSPVTRTTGMPALPNPHAPGRMDPGHHYRAGHGHATMPGGEGTAWVSQADAHLRTHPLCLSVKQRWQSTSGASSPPAVAPPPARSACSQAGREKAYARQPPLLHLNTKHHCRSRARAWRRPKPTVPGMPCGLRTSCRDHHHSTQPALQPCKSPPAPAPALSPPTSPPLPLKTHDIAGSPPPCPRPLTAAPASISRRVISSAAFASSSSTPSSSSSPPALLRYCPERAPGDAAQSPAAAACSSRRAGTMKYLHACHRMHAGLGANSNAQCGTTHACMLLPRQRHE